MTPRESEKHEATNVVWLNHHHQRPGAVGIVPRLLQFDRDPIPDACPDHDSIANVYLNHGPAANAYPDRDSIANAYLDRAPVANAYPDHAPSTGACFARNPAAADVHSYSDRDSIANASSRRRSRAI
jgi:hypothetical protein